MPFLIAKSDSSASNLPHMHTIYQNTSNKNFEKTMLFNTIERSGNYVLEDDNLSTAFRGTVISNALGAYKVYVERAIVNTPEWAYSIGNQMF